MNHERRYLIIKAFVGEICATKYLDEARKEKKKAGVGTFIWDRQGKNPAEGQRGCEVA